MTKLRFPPIHPGEILDEEFLKPFKLSPEKLSQQILSRKKGLNANIGPRLARYLKASEQFWMNLQSY